MENRLLLLLVLAGSNLPAPGIDVHDLVRRSVQVIEGDWSQAPRYSFIERDVQSKKHSTPTVKSYEVLMIDGSFYHRLVAINDRPLSAAERQVEEQKQRTEIEKRQRESERERAKRVGKYEKERAQNRAMLLAMVDAFDFQLSGEERIDGHDCWVLDARPKPGYQPPNRDTKVLIGMRGRLWIDKQSTQWAKVQAEVVKPVSFYGFVAKVGPGTKFMLEQEPVAANLWLPKRFSVKVNATALGFINEDSSTDETYRDYKAGSVAVDVGGR